MVDKWAINVQYEQVSNIKSFAKVGCLFNV